jgi:hypothetical protein
VKKLLLPALVATALLCTSCLGPNKTFISLGKWNDTATDYKWANEAIFIGLWIVPVYEVCYLGDVVILNSIDFWSEKK